MSAGDFKATAISGSITRLVDGKSYLVQGSGIEIVSGSDASLSWGQVKISATGGGGGMTSWNIEGDSGSTAVSNGQTVDIAGGTGVITSESSRTVTVNLDYVGVDNAILAASSATPVSSDIIWFSDGDDSTIKNAAISSLPFAAGTMSSFTIQDDNGNTQTIEDSDTLDFKDGTGVNIIVSATDDVTIGLDYSAGDSFIMAATDGTGITVDASNDKLALYDDDASLVKYVNVSQVTAGGGSQWTDGGGLTGPLYPADNSGAQTVIIGNTTAGNADIILGSDGSAIFNEQASDADFRVQSQNNQGIILVDAGTDTLLFGTKATVAADEILGTDVAIYLSGTSGSMGGATRGLSLASGDFLISGSTVIGKRQGTSINGYKLEVSGSSRAGCSYRGRLEHIYGSFTYDLENPAPRFLPLVQTFSNLTSTVGKKGEMMSSLTIPHNASIAGVKVTLSGSGTVAVPGNSQIAFYTSTGTSCNVLSIEQAGSGLTFAAAPSGFARGQSALTNITSLDGTTWDFGWGGVSTLEKDRVLLMAISFSNGPSAPGKFHGSYTVTLEYNELS